MAGRPEGRSAEATVNFRERRPGFPSPNGRSIRPRRQPQSPPMTGNDATRRPGPVGATLCVDKELWAKARLARG